MSGFWRALMLAAIVAMLVLAFTERLGRGDRLPAPAEMTTIEIRIPPR